MYYCPMFKVYYLSLPSGTIQELIIMGVGLQFDIRSICSVIYSTSRFCELYFVTIILCDNNK